MCRVEMGVTQVQVVVSCLPCRQWSQPGSGGGWFEREHRDEVAEGLVPQVGRKETGGPRDSRQVDGSEDLRWLTCTAPSTSRKDSELSQLTLRVEDEQLLGAQLQKKIKELQVCGARGGQSAGRARARGTQR